MATQKLYPFSVQKHAHDIEYRKNRLFCEMRDIDMGEVQADAATYNRIVKQYEAVTELLEAVLNSRDGRVAYLNGAQIGLAKECVAWASNRRADSLIKAGKYQYLRYC